jgi:beta-lactamase class A
MIRQSCNQCANRMIERVGEQHLIDVVQSPRFGFYQPNVGGLWLGKEYGSHPAWRREPLRKLSHAATTFQTARYYCGLQNGTLVSPEQNRLMLDTLSNPGIHHKFVKGLRTKENIEIFRKSGTWSTYHADSALVRSGEDVYVIVGLANNPRGGRWLEQLASPIHELVLKKHNSG